ncbi:MAG TPA: MBL fold metallo-hydrolase [Actinopolymorphaceae bacterium]|jgi:hypothetical protein
MAKRLRLTLLGVGAMRSPRYAPACLLARYGRRRILFDGGPGIALPDRIDAWLVSDERSELRSALSRMAGELATKPRATDLDLDELRIECLPVAHTSHPTYGYRILGAGAVVVWAPEFWEFPEWARNADLMFAEAAAWNRPIRFRGGVGGHACVRDVARQARRGGVRRLVFVHIGRPSIRAIDQGLAPEFGEWGQEGRTYQV